MHFIEHMSSIKHDAHGKKYRCSMNHKGEGESISWQQPLLAVHLTSRGNFVRTSCALLMMLPLIFCC